MEKINIAEILKDCPKGMELDCTMYDNVTLIQVQEDNIYPIKIETPDGSTVLTKYGGVSYNKLSKCIIFPKGKTTWEGFHKPFDKVLVRSDNSDIWQCDFFSSYNPKCSNRFHCIGIWSSICIPYIGNEHLLGTTDDCDDFYKTWE